MDWNTIPEHGTTIRIEPGTSNNEEDNCFRLEWTVENFASKFIDRHLGSPKFKIPFNESEWRLALYYTHHNSAFYGVRADCRNCLKPIKAVCTFSILNQQNKMQVNSKENGFSWQDFDEGNFAIIPSFILQSDLHGLMQDGKLKIIFDVRMFRTNKNTDEILLNAMFFRYQISSSLNNILNHVYLDKKMNHIEYLFGVLKVASENEIHVVENTCMEALDNILTVDNSLEFLEHASRFNFPDLEKKAKDFIKLHQNHPNLAEI